MFYVQLQNRAKVEMGQQLRLTDAAKVIGPGSAKAILLPCPQE